MQRACKECGASKPVCCLCKKPIKGKVYYQGGSRAHPVHKGCLTVIKRSKDGGI
jgi:hypothetical protein